MKKLLRITNKLFLFLLAAAVIGCGKESRRTDYVARVNNSYLTEQDIEQIISSTPGKNFYRNEIIRSWIDREILYQKAVDEGIVKQEKYKRIIDDSKKELAAAMLLEQVYNGEELTTPDDEINEFFNLHKEDFKLTENHYLINKAIFMNEDKAVNFRTLVMESNWKSAVKDFSEKNSFEQKSPMLVGESELHPAALLRIVAELYPGEISIVITDTPDEYTIVEMLQKYHVGTIPPLEVVKESVTRRLIKKKKDEMIKNYIRELYSDSQIDIKQE